MSIPDSFHPPQKNLHIDISGIRIWWLWMAVVSATAVVQFLTLRISPTIWQDEVQIIDYGRILAPDSNQTFAMSWGASGKPFKSPSCLGASLQNFAYIIAGEDLAGPRTSALVGALLASAALLGWLLARRAVPWIALGCAVIFLWDPIFSQGYRGARVDSWAMALMLAACWLVRLGSNGLAGWRVTLAGVFVGTAGLVWVSAVLLVPLLVHEVIDGRRNAGTRCQCFTSSLVSLLHLGIVALLTIMFLLLPYADILQQMMADLKSGVGSHVSEAKWNYDELLAPFKLSPWVALVALVVFAWPRYWSQGIVFVIAVAGVLATSVYIHRVVYLLPYLMLALASGASGLWVAEGRVWSKRAVAAVVGGMLLWAGGISLGARTAVAWHERQERQPEVLVSMLEALEENIFHGNPPEAPRVLLGNWDLYYAARGAGWHFFKMAKSWNAPELQDFARGMDLVIYRADEPRAPDSELMESLGFEKMVVSANQRARRVELGSGIKSAAPYSDYVVWRKR